MPPGPHVLYVRGTRTSLGRWVRTAYCGNPGYNEIWQDAAPALRLRPGAKELLASEAQRLFKKYPALTSFSWRQYTPYWIDGDACNFSAELAYPNLNGNDYYSAGDDPSLKEARQDIIAMLRTFDDSYLMYRLFGDHKIVKVNREGIFVETYEHG